MAAARHAALLLVLSLAACTGPAPAPAPGAELQALPGPNRGAPLAQVLAALEAPPGAAAQVSLEELRLVRRDGARWEAVSRAAAEAETGSLGAIARRRCTLRQGLRSVREERTSWYAFEGGRLLAFDHASFDPGCRVRRRFAPARDEALDTEQVLVRFVAQRDPGQGLATTERLELGLALVEARRLDEARAALRTGDHALEALGHERERARPEEQEDLELRERELRALRLSLQRAILHAEAERDAAREAQRDGR